ncbi:MAG: hypothetical protein Tsb0034_01060 [Ekhidna sp.]
MAQTSQVSLENTHQFQIESAEVSEAYTISVALPFGYSGNENSYKTLYVLDANVTFGMVRDIQTLISFEPENPPLLVVGIGYKNLNDWIRKRSRDYKPSEAQPEAVDRFIRFLDNELLPHIDSTYRTSDERLLYGHSSAGLLGLYAMTQKNDFFDGYIMTSPSVDEDGGITLARLKQADLQFSKPTRLYLSIGSKEKASLQTAYSELEATLKNADSSNLTYISERVDATHMASMAPAFIKGLQFVNKTD